MNNKEGYYIDVNGIKTIIQNDTHLFFQHNKIKELTLNHKLEYLCCYNNNQLTELKLNNNLKELYCDINTKLVNIRNNCNIQIYE